MNVVSNNTLHPNRVHKVNQHGDATVCNLPWYMVRPQARNDTTVPCRVCFAEKWELYDLREQKRQLQIRIRELRLEANFLRVQNIQYERLLSRPIWLRCRSRLWPLVRKMIK